MNCPTASSTWSASTPTRSTVPSWYEPNPHRAGDIAFVLFTGEGPSTKAHPDHQQALGIVSARHGQRRRVEVQRHRLQRHADPPLVRAAHDASAARWPAVPGSRSRPPRTPTPSGTRSAATARRMSRTPGRRCGTSRTRPPNPNERHHPIRMFIGSGMPRNLWTRVAERFPETRILEFYASAEGEAILANLTGHKPGSHGQTAPRYARGRVAAFDLDAHGTRTHQQRRRPRVSRPTRSGCCSAASPRVTCRLGSPMRGALATDDAWRSTGDLFLRDDQGDHWLAGWSRRWSRRPRARCSPAGTRFCLGNLPGSDLVVAYGYSEGDARGSRRRVVRIARHRPSTRRELDKALDRLPPTQRPRYVQVVPSIPLTTWDRPIWRDLQRKGVPSPRADAGCGGGPTTARTTRSSKPPRPRKKTAS